MGIILIGYASQPMAMKISMAILPFVLTKMVSMETPRTTVFVASMARIYMLMYTAKGIVQAI